MPTVREEREEREEKERERNGDFNAFFNTL
jgi:hypothetical protein